MYYIFKNWGNHKLFMAFYFETLLILNLILQVQIVCLLLLQNALKIQALISSNINRILNNSNWLNCPVVQESVVFNFYSDAYFSIFWWRIILFTVRFNNLAYSSIRKANIVQNKWRCLIYLVWYNKLFYISWAIKKHGDIWFLHQTL